MTSASSQLVEMTFDAIKTLSAADRKGASVPGITKHIHETHGIEISKAFKAKMRKALEKGFEEGFIIRPATSEIKGVSLTGRYKSVNAKFETYKKGAVKTGKTSSTSSNLNGSSQSVATRKPKVSKTTAKIKVVAGSAVTKKEMAKKVIKRAKARLSSVASAPNTPVRTRAKKTASKTTASKKKSKAQ